MTIVLSTLKKILFWSYDRGTWQYDIMCVLILAFIFFGPNDVFHDHRPAKTTPIWVSRGTLIEADPRAADPASDANDLLAQYLARQFGNTVAIARIERVVDDSGNVTGYDVWEK